MSTAFTDNFVCYVGIATFVLNQQVESTEVVSTINSPSPECIVSAIGHRKQVNGLSTRANAISLR
jgi:hypothetical protein